MAKSAELQLLLTAKDQASAVLGKVGGALKMLGAAALVYAGAKGLGAIGKSLNDMVGLAEKEAAGIAKLDASLKTAGQSYANVGGQIEAYLSAEAQRIAMDDGAGRESLARLTMATGDYNTALSLLPLSADLAAAKGMDLVSASELVGKVAAGNVSMLTRYGIVLQEGATAEEALAAMQQRFAGQAEAFGNTSAGAAQKLKIAWDNAKEGFGAGFMGAFANVRSSLAGLLTKFGPAISTIGTGLGAIANGAFNAIKSLVSSVMASMGVDMDSVASNAEGWGQNIVLTLARGISGAMRYVVGALARIGQTITGLLRPGSPPKLLPNLDAWGTEAAAVYMQGWGEADFDMFDALSAKIGSYLDTIPKMAQEKLIPLKAAVNAALAGAINTNPLGAAAGDYAMFDSVLASIKKLPPSFIDYAHSLISAQRAQNNLTAAMTVLEQAAADVERAQEGLDAATKATARAQNELNRVTKQYDAMLAPLDKELQAIEDKKQAIEDQKQLAQLQKDANNKGKSAADRALARLEIEAIKKRQQITAVERERDVAVDAEQQKVDAAQAAQDAEQAKADAAQEAQAVAQKAVDAAQKELDTAKKLVGIQERLLGIQTDANAAVKQQNDLLEQMAAAAAAAAKAAAGLGAAMEGGSFEGVLADVGFGDAGALGDMSGLQDQIASMFDMSGLKDELAASWGGEGGLLSMLFPKAEGTGEFDKYGNEIVAAIPPLGERLKAAWDALKPDLEEKLTEIGTTVGAGLLKGIGTSLSKLASDAWTKFEEQWNILADSIDVIVNSWLDQRSIQLGVWWNGLIAKITTWWANLKSNLGLWLSGLLIDFTTWLTNVWNTFSTKLTELWTLVGAKFDEIKAAITTKWGEAEAFLKGINLANIGKDIMNGLLGGLKSKWESVKAWLEDKARQVANIWANITGSHSESTVFHALGLDIPAGLLGGLKEGWGAVENTLRNQALSLPSMMAPAMAPAMPLAAAAAGPAFPTAFTMHLVLDIPGLGATAETDVTVDTKSGVAAAQNMTLHASSKGV